MCFEINRVQLVHRGVQRELCSSEFGNRLQAARDTDFSEFTQLSRTFSASNIEFPTVKILRESLLGAGVELLMRSGRSAHASKTTKGGAAAKRVMAFTGWQKLRATTGLDYSNVALGDGPSLVLSNPVKRGLVREPQQLRPAN